MCEKWACQEEIHFEIQPIVVPLSIQDKKFFYYTITLPHVLLKFGVLNPLLTIKHIL